MIASLDNVLFQSFSGANPLPAVGLLFENVVLQAQAVVDALRQPTPDLSKIPNLTDLTQTIQAWSDIVAFANSAQQTNLSPQTITLT